MSRSKLPTLGYMEWNANPSIFDRVCLRCVDDKEAFGFLRYSLLMLAVHIWEWPFDVSGSYLEMEF